MVDKTADQQEASGSAAPCRKCAAAPTMAFQHGQLQQLLQLQQQLQQLLSHLWDLPVHWRSD